MLLLLMSPQRFITNSAGVLGSAPISGLNAPDVSVRSEIPLLKASTNRTTPPCFTISGQKFCVVFHTNGAHTALQMVKEIHNTSGFLVPSVTSVSELDFPPKTIGFVSRLINAEQVTWRADIPKGQERVDENCPSGIDLASQ